MKSALLLLALLLSTTTTWAANPLFNDVPRKHWAYQALNSLTKVGLMPKNDYHGYFYTKEPHLLTRYEFAVGVQRIPKEDKAHPFSAANRKWIRRLRTEFRSEIDLIEKQKKAIP